MLPLPLLVLALALPSEARLVTGSGVRLRTAGDKDAAVSAVVGFGAVVDCDVRSAVVDVGGGKRGVFCRHSEWPPLWYFEPNTVAVAKDATAQLHREIAKRTKELTAAPKERFADVYDLQFFLLRHSQLDDVDDAERARLQGEELALVEANPKAFVGDARFVGGTLRRDLPAPQAIALVAKSLGLTAAQIEQLSSLNALVAAQRKKPTAEGFCALETRAVTIAGGFPSDKWTEQVDVIEPQLAQLSAALTGIAVVRHAVGVVAGEDLGELAALGPANVSAFVDATDGLLTTWFSVGFRQVTDDQACFDVAAFTQALEAAAPSWAAAPPCLRALLETRLARNYESAAGWTCFCEKKNVVDAQLPAYATAAKAWASSSWKPPALTTKRADVSYADGCHF